ncbi:ras and Rab interactor 3-like [Equus caballus]|uniref:ras and Rab interactor 3-like n=1 Tax=Equus caballus TaxID=9796 RepID=UPI0038B2538F
MSSPPPSERGRRGRGGAARNREACRPALTHGRLLTRVPRSTPRTPHRQPRGPPLKPRASHHGGGPPSPSASVRPPGGRRPSCPLGPPATTAALKAAIPTPPPPVRVAARVGRKDPRALTAAERLPRSLLSCGPGLFPAGLENTRKAKAAKDSLPSHPTQTPGSRTFSLERERTWRGLCQKTELPSEQMMETGLVITWPEITDGIPDLESEVVLEAADKTRPPF